MSSTARKVSITALILLLLLAGGLYYLASNLNGIVAGVIESQGSAATQTPVSVAGVDIQLTDASAALSGLSVGNPEGFPGNAIELGGFSVKLDAGSLTSDPIVINDITVDGARINILQQTSGNNLQKLLANLQAMLPEERPESEAAGKKVIIDKFTLNDASASVSIPALNETREVSLPPIVVRDIGRESKGATAAQVAEQILRPILEKAIASASVEAAKDRVGKEIGKAVDGLLKGLGKSKDE